MSEVTKQNADRTCGKIGTGYLRCGLRAAHKGQHQDADNGTHFGPNDPEATFSIPTPPEPPVGYSWTYWCRYHGRYEESSSVEACRTTLEITAENERKRNRKCDRPCLWARIKMALGFEVTP